MRAFWEMMQAEILASMMQWGGAYLGEGTGTGYCDMCRSFCGMDVDDDHHVFLMHLGPILCLNVD